jgi:AcrR family transcriptional regulator
MTVEKVAAAAGVSVGSLYARFTYKDGLTHAVQHDVLEEVDTELRDAYARLAERSDLTMTELIAEAVRALADQVTRHLAVMRPLMLRAAAEPALRARGNATRELAEELFVTLLLARSGELDCQSPRTAVPMAFRTVFSTAMWQVMLGPDAGLRHATPLDRVQQELATICQSYLLRSPALSTGETKGDV